MKKEWTEFIQGGRRVYQASVCVRGSLVHWNLRPIQLVFIAIRWINMM